MQSFLFALHMCRGVVVRIRAGTAKMGFDTNLITSILKLKCYHKLLFQIIQIFQIFQTIKIIKNIRKNKIIPIFKI